MVKMRRAFCGAGIFGLLLIASGVAQDPPADSEILYLGEKLLIQAKAQHDKSEWVDAIESAERARTAFLALSELYASQNRVADLRKLNDSVTQCNQLIRLARDARKAAQEKLAPPPDPKKPADPAAPPKDAAGAVGAVPKPPAKPEIPAVEAQENALKAVREVFQAEYARSTPAARQALAKRLLQEAERTKGDQAAQYVLFREAAELAAQASDVATAFGAIDAMSKVFAMEALALKVATLSKLPLATTHELSGPSVEACLKVADEASWGDHYDLAAFVVRKAEQLARSPLNVTLVAKTQARAKEILEIQKEYESTRSAAKALLEKPDHSLSNLAVGRFLCFQKADWDRGLPLLRKGVDPDLRKLADIEVTNPRSAEAAMKLADGWWTIADKELSQIAKDRIRANSRLWYQRSLPELSGFPKTRVQKRLQELDEQETSRWGMDLLKLIDPKKDAVSGNWIVDGSSLVSPSGDNRQLQIPFAPPDEYDLKVVAARREGPNAALIMGLVGGNKQFCMDMDAWDGSTGGLALLDGRAGNSNETTFRTKVFSDDGSKTLLWEVRKDKVVFSADGKRLLEWKADYRRLSNPAVYVFPSKRALYLTTWYAGVRFQQILLIPISGHGQKLR